MMTEELHPLLQEINEIKNVKERLKDIPGFMEFKYYYGLGMHPLLLGERVANTLQRWTKAGEKHLFDSELDPHDFTKAVNNFNSGRKESITLALDDEDFGKLQKEGSEIQKDAYVIRNKGGQLSVHVYDEKELKKPIAVGKKGTQLKHLFAAATAYLVPFFWSPLLRRGEKKYGRTGVITHDKFSRIIFDLNPDKVSQPIEFTETSSHKDSPLLKFTKGVGPLIEELYKLRERTSYWAELYKQYLEAPTNSKEEKKAKAMEILHKLENTPMEIRLLGAAVNYVELMHVAGHATTEDKQHLADSAIQFYSPFLRRGGLNGVADEMENKAFEVLSPTDYKDAKNRMEGMKRQISEKKELVKDWLRGVGSQNGLSVDGDAREKSLWRIHQKMQRKGGFGNIIDLLGSRAIINHRNEENCYAFLEGLKGMVGQKIGGVFHEN